VVSAAHAQAAREVEAQHEEEARREPRPDQPVRRKRSGKASRRVPDAVNGAASPERTLRSEPPGPQPQRGQWPEVDADFDTAPVPRLTASGAIASPEADNSSSPSPRTAAANGAVKPDLANQQRPAARPEQAAARQKEERAARERARLEQERTAQERARLEQERAAQEQARLEQERAAQELAKQERARQVQEDLAKQERKRAARQERAAQRERSAVDKRAARQERERAAQELVEQKRAAQEQARQEQEHAAEELARQLEELAAQERIRQEQEREDREWAAQKRARLEREREEAEELARREHPAAEHNGAAQLVPRQFAAAEPSRADLPAPPPSRGPEIPGPRRYRTSALIAAVVVLLGAGSLAVARSLHHSAHPPAGAGGIAATIRNEAAAWVAQQVSPSAVVSCDPAMCLALKAQGVPTYDLLVLEPTAPTPFGSKFVLATAAIRKQFGSRLASVYAPAVIASFGSGSAQIDVRQIAPNGAAAFWSGLRTDQQQRKTFEKSLLGSLQIVASASARRQLAAGQIDERLATLIEGMASELPLPVHILAFGDLGPGASPGIPLRSATLAGSKATLRTTLAWARKATPPFAPTHATVTQLNGQPVLIVEFAAPSPLGVFSPSNP
jgi:hypothetical protein